MAAKKGPDDREKLYVNVEQTERKVIPAVQLERREIKMTFSPLDPSLSPAAAVTDQQKQVGRIVGTEYVTASPADDKSLGLKVTEREEPVKQVTEGAESQRSRSHQKQEVHHANVLEFFEEQGKSFLEHGKTLVAPKPRKDRSASPSQMRQSVGLDHLDNLVKLMEQLSQLKDENARLKKKCDYLESTKTLLQAKSAVETEITIPSSYHTLPAKSKSVKSPKVRRRVHLQRPRLPSAEDIDVLESCESLESSSDTSPKRPKHSQLHKRSFSTGSLEIPSDIMEQSGEDDTQDGLYHQNGKIKSKISKSPTTKRKGKISNWSRIKKVLAQGRQRLPEDIGFSLRSLSRFGGNVRIMSSGSTKELSVPVTTVENRSVDSGVGSGLEADASDSHRKSTGGMSDEFSKKMQQWEELKTRKPQQAIMKDSSDASDGVFSSDSFGAVSPEFQKKMDDWERSKSIKSTSSHKTYLEEKSEGEGRGSRDGSPDGTASPLETSIQSINVEDMQKKLTDSFSRKMEEWERRKYRRESPTLDRKDSGGKSAKKDDRPKTRGKSKVEKDKEKLEKMRGREMRRVEIEQQKLEKDKIRIEKERLKALEREARLEKLKGRLSQPEMESKFKSPILAPLAEYKVTSDFAKKLHEWEMRKGITSVSMATYYESQLRQTDHSHQQEYSGQKDSDDEVWHEPKKVKGQKPPPLILQPCFDSPEEASPGGRSSDGSFDDHTSITMESMTENNIKSLESANASLVEELRAKEREYEALQHEVQDLSEKVNSARTQHSKEIGGASVQVPKLTQEMGSKLAELESKISELQSFGDNLAQKMESAAMCKWQSIEGEESVTTRLVELLEKMRLMLYKASHTEELTQKSSALYTFEKLYSQAMQLQVQLTNLRLSQLERNKEIVTMKRQLLLQEANNLLLQADIARRETELNWHKQHARKGMPIKRWNTYGGMESRVVEGQETECIPPYKRFAKGRKESAEPTVTSEDIDETVETEEQKPEPLEVGPPESPIEIQHKSSIYLPMRKNNETKQSKLHKEMSLEIPLIDQEQEDAVRILPDNVKDGQVIRGEKGVEISLTIKLPTANVNLPRDISQQELNVPRSSRQDDSVKAEPIIHKSEAKFPELLIPKVQKSPKLEHVSSIEIPEARKLAKVSKVEVSDFELQIRSEKEKSITEEERLKRESNISIGSDSVFVESGTPKQQKKIQIPVRVTKMSDCEIPSHQSSNQESHRETHRETITISPKLVHKPLIRKPQPTSPSNTAPVAEKTFNWPRIRQVSYVGHRIKPADELLEESKRYRKGQSAYMSRILQKYKTDESRKFLMERQKSHDKENIAEGYVQAIVKKLSREGTPDMTGESTPKQYISYRSDSPQGRSEFVQQIVKKLSSPADQPRSQSSPLKDVTNGIPKKVKKLTEVFDSGSARSTPERALSDSECQSHRSKYTSSKSKDRTLSVTYDSSSSTSTLTSIAGASEMVYHPETSASAPLNYSSLPLLSVKEEDSSDLQQSYRERAATTTTCDSAADQGIKGQMEKQELHVTLSPWQQIKSASQEFFSHHSHHVESSPQPSSSKRSEVKLQVGHRPSKVKKETIGALCQQSMLSFDLGLTMQASEQVQFRKDSEADSGYSGKSPRPLSSGSDSEPSSSSEDKRKSKSKFFETHWFHKPKRFFKVSK